MLKGLGKRKISSFTYVFASFFGAFMIAGSFAYFNYKFSEYKFINFNKIVLYSKSDIFEAKDDYYIMIIYKY